MIATGEANSIEGTKLLPSDRTAVKRIISYLRVAMDDFPPAATDEGTQSVLLLMSIGPVMRLSRSDSAVYQVH
jgi:hypothetical protein